MTITTVAFANDDLKIYDGSVTLENGEILTGKIQMLSPTLNEVKVKFIDSEGQTTTYKSKEVVSYRFVFPKYNAKTKTYDNETIEYVKKTVSMSPIPFGPKEVLVERQAEGTIDLYSFYAETRAAAHAFTHSYFIEKDGEMIEVNRTNFKTIVKDIVADYSELQDKVGKKGYTYKSITTIINEYNNYKSSKEVAFGMR